MFQETNEARFQVIIQQLLSYLLESYPHSYIYFKNSYVPHTSQWAFCYCIGAMVNTDMFVEAFDCELKSVYFQGKQNLKIERLLYTLLKIAQDIVFQRLCKDEIGKRTYRILEILKRCRAAKDMRDKGAN